MKQQNLLKYKLLGLNSFTVSFDVFSHACFLKHCYPFTNPYLLLQPKGGIPYGNLISVIVMVILIDLYQFSIVLFDSYYGQEHDVSIHCPNHILYSDFLGVYPKREEN
jgi:hypothetical protein